MVSVYYQVATLELLDMGGWFASGQYTPHILRPYGIAHREHQVSDNECHKDRKDNNRETIGIVIVIVIVIGLVLRMHLHI